MWLAILKWIAGLFLGVVAEKVNEVHTSEESVSVDPDLRSELDRRVRAAENRASAARGSGEDRPGGSEG